MREPAHIRLPFQRELSAADSPAEHAARVRLRDHGKAPCQCAASPWCRGRDSADWASCSASCAACAPIPWRPPTRTPADADGDPLTARPIEASDPSSRGDRP